MTFGAPEWFWGLLLVPVLIAFFIRSEQRGAERLREFVSAKLLPQLAATVNRRRRVLRFGLQLVGLALAVVSLAQPRWGYTFEDVKRKGLDLLIAVDTSRSMLSNDVQPDRLERVKLAAHDLISELRGDRVGLIAFAGRAFLQAPLTIDYDAVLESVNDLDTKTIPEGGTNISEAIGLAAQIFGKSAIGNRALIIFTDGEELSGDSAKTAKAAADAGLRIFTIGVGTPQGSLIPILGENGGTSFVKDAAGQVVKSKLDEKRLSEIAQAAGGFYLHLENGPRAMQQLYTEGLAKMQAVDIDARLSRRPIERYEWPLGAALIVLALSILIRERERRRVPERNRVSGAPKMTAATAALVLTMFQIASGAAPGLDAYRDGNFNDAYNQFQETLKQNPESHAKDALQFDAGAAAYKMKEYGKALESFSQALLTPDRGLQAKSHYNLGNTLYQHGDGQTSKQNKLNDWRNALEHYKETLKIEPNNQAAKENYEYVKKKIDDLNKQQPPTPTPSPSPQENKQNQQKQQQQQGGQGQQQQQQQSEQKQGGGGQQKDKQQQSQNQQPQNGKENQQSQGNGDKQSSEQPKPTESSSPSPGEGKQERPQNGSESSPSPGPGSTATPTPNEGTGEGTTPSPAPSPSPQKKPGGELKEAGEQTPDAKSEKNGEIGEAEPEKEGEMSEQQALALLQSMKDEEARVQLDEHKAVHHVYKDW